MDLIFSEDMIPYDDDKGDLRYRVFLKGHLDFVHDTIKNSPAEHTPMYFHFSSVDKNKNTMYLHSCYTLTCCGQRQKMKQYDRDLIVLVFLRRLPGPLLVSFPHRFLFQI